MDTSPPPLLHDGDFVDWHAGRDHTSGWALYITILCFSLTFNIGTFSLLTYSSHLKYSSSSLLVRYLSLEDAIFSFICLIQCLVNVGHLEFVGEEALCIFQTSYVLFFFFATGFTLCCIAYNSERKVAMKQPLTGRAIFWIHLCGWCYCFLFAILSSYVLKPGHLVLSGTYCLHRTFDLTSSLVAMLGGVLPLVTFIHHRYYLIFKSLRAHVKLLASGEFSQSTKINEAARAQNIAASKRMFLLILTFEICLIPAVITSLYELATKEQIPASLDIIVGTLVHCNSLINPILYVYLNKQMRLTITELFTSCKRKMFVNSLPSVTTRPSNKSLGIQSTPPFNKECRSPSSIHPLRTPQLQPLTISSPVTINRTFMAFSATSPLSNKTIPLEVTVETPTNEKLPTPVE